MTVTEIPAEVPAHYGRQDHAEYIARLLTPEKIRSSALSCIVIRDTPDFLRLLAARHIAGLDPVWLAWADEIDLLAAHGFTGSTPLGAAKIALAVNGATAADFRNPKAFPDRPETRRWVLTVADEMDALTAEGFDAEVYAKEIDRACGGTR